MELTRLITFAVLTIITIFQILLISFYLFIKKKGNVVNKTLLGSFLITCAVFISGTFILIIPKLKVVTYDTAHLLNLTVFLAVPILFLHFKSLFKSDYEISVRKVLFHALPFLVIIIYLIYYILILGHRKYVFYPTAIYLISLLFIQNIIYFFLMLREIRTVPETNGNRAKLKLFRFLLASALVIFSLKLILFVVWNILQYNDICIFITGIFFLIVFIIINSFVIFSLNNPELLLGVPKYQSSLLSKEELEKYMSLVDSSMLRENFFTDPLISLERMSKNIKIPEKLLSQVINQSSGLNFNDFINKYRVENAKKMMLADDSRKVLEIAYECGFNSKTTFNSAFKKFTGVTPSEFKKNPS
jgi:AraC-like DNA-binding protein